MKRIISLILISIVTISLSLAGVITYYTYENKLNTAANVVKYLHFQDEDYDREIKVEIYSRVKQDVQHAPMFAICELINKSINYRIKHPEATEMTIDSAFYRVEPETACYYKKGSRNYGKMTLLKDRDYTDDCERLLYSYVKAAKYGIHTRFMWLIANDIHNKPIMDYFNNYMEQECIFDSTKKVKDFLELRNCTWQNGGISQMHNKQVLVSNYLDYDGKEYEDTVYTATSNIDYYYSSSNLPITGKDWAHTGFTISNHPYVYGSNSKYFDICFRHFDNRFEFANEVFECHNKGSYLDGGLNYIDENFECFFTPLSQEYSADLYDDTNPLAKYIEKLNDSQGKIECYANQYCMGTDIFVTKCVRRLHDAFTNNKTKGNSFGIIENISLDYDHELHLKLREIGNITLKRMTHAKDFIFHYGESEEYVVVTGSTNFSLVNYYGQSNTIMVFKEKGNEHQIYDCYYDNYLRTVSSKSYAW